MDEILTQLFPSARVPGIVALIHQYTVEDLPWSTQMGWAPYVHSLPPPPPQTFPFAHDRNGGRIFVYIEMTGEIQSLTEGGTWLATTPWTIPSDCRDLAFDAYNNRLLIHRDSHLGTRLAFADTSNRFQFGNCVSFAEAATHDKRSKSNIIIDANGLVLITLGASTLVLDSDGHVFCAWTDWIVDTNVWISFHRGGSVLSLENHLLNWRHFYSGASVGYAKLPKTRYFDGQVPYTCIGYDIATGSTIVNSVVDGTNVIENAHNGIQELK